MTIGELKEKIKSMDDDVELEDCVEESIEATAQALEYSNKKVRFTLNKTYNVNDILEGEDIPALMKRYNTTDISKVLFEYLTDEGLFFDYLYEFVNCKLV